MVANGSSSGDSVEGEGGCDGGNTEGIEYPEPVESTIITSSINKYKYLIREILPKNIRESFFREHLINFENNENIKSLYDVFGFDDELQNIGNQYYHLRNQLSFDTFIESILNRIGDYAKNLTESSANRTVLMFLYTAALSKLCSINFHENRVSMINLLEHLESVKENVDDLRESIKEATIFEYQNKCKRSLLKKIELVNEFIQIQIKSKFENILIETKNKIPRLIDEVLNQNRTTRDQWDELSDRRKNLENMMRLHMMLNVAKVINPTLEFFGSIARVVVEMIGGVTSISDAFYNSIKAEPLMIEEKSKLLKLIDSVGSLLLVIRDRFSSKHNLLLQQLNDIVSEFKNHSNDWTKSIQEEAIKLKLEIRADFSGETIPDPNKIEGMRSKMRMVLEEIKPPTNSDKKLLEHLKNIISISNISLGIYDQIRNNKTKIEEVVRTITNLNGRHMQWEESDAKMYALILPLIRSIQNGVKFLIHDMNNQSHIELSIPKNLVQHLLCAVKTVLANATDFTLFQRALEPSKDKLFEGLALLIDVFDRIDAYSEKAKLTAYYLHSRSRHETNEIASIILNLKENIRTNLILDQYEEMMQALRQYQFPFGNFRLETVELPSDLQFTDSTTLIRKIEDYISYMKERIKFSNLPFGNYDQEMFVSSFYSFSNSFYTWSDWGIRFDVEKLLDGDEIIIKADITNGLAINALRFNEIGIQFSTENSSLQNELDNILQNFHLRMTIVGNNYLRCDSRIYYTSLDDEIVIEYSLKKDSSGRPSRTNEMYRKITGRAFFFSPYVMWKIRLISSDSGSTNVARSFKELSEFKNIPLDLRLIGRGQYYKSQEIHSYGICNEQLDAFYQVDSSILFTNFHVFKYQYFY